MFFLVEGPDAWRAIYLPLPDICDTKLGFRLNRKDSTGNGSNMMHFPLFSRRVALTVVLEHLEDCQ
jgi:hypothetical protein